jgi:hypothetical protein
MKPPIQNPCNAVVRRVGLEAKKLGLPRVIVPLATPRASLMRGSYSNREHVKEA